MISIIFQKIVCSLCSCIGDSVKYDLYEYAIYILLSSILHFISVIAFGLIFNLILESIVFYSSFILIRKFAGGYHAKKPTSCYLFSIIATFIILALVKSLLCNVEYFKFHSLISLVAFVCMMFIWILSPIDTENKPLNVTEKKIYKKIAIIISLIVFISVIIFLFLGIYNIALPLLCGLFMSSLVLVMRKIQIIKTDI